MTIGALSGGKIMYIGRRRTLFLGITIGITGVCITMVWNLYTIMIGRFLFGYSSGLMSVVLPRFIEETVPLHLMEKLTICTLLGQNISGLLTGSLAFILPPDSDTDALMKD